MKSIKLISTSILFVLLFSCNNEEIINPTEKLDYSNLHNWASNPAELEKEVDVFFVYPTLFGGTSELNMNIESEDMRGRVDAVLLKQASVFTDDCNLFAPFYRQISMDCLSMSDEEKEKYFSIGYSDVENAFEYYIKNLNNGRPFILAGHSQGSMMLIELMKEKFNSTALMDKLVAAYLIGYSITEEDLKNYNWFKISKNSNDIGTIITYNTQSVNAKNSPVLLPNAKCVNPLIWTDSSEYASKEMNMGAVFFKEDGHIDSLVANFTDAWISENGALTVGINDDKTYGNASFPKGVYHVYDYSFFYNNLKQNIGVRIDSYQRNNK